MQHGTVAPSADDSVKSRRQASILHPVKRLLCILSIIFIYAFYIIIDAFYALVGRVLASCISGYGSGEN